jgi:predicted TPR repeat methyltransferase
MYAIISACLFKWFMVHSLSNLTHFGKNKTTLPLFNDDISTLVHRTKCSFEHSLVEELGYNGFKKLRKAFDNALGGEEKVPKFDLVIDAGCGTGLVGEQVRGFEPTHIGMPRHWNIHASTTCTCTRRQ